MDETLPKLLFLGHPPAWLVNELSPLTLECDCFFATELADLSKLPALDLIMVYQSHYDEFHQDDIDKAIGQFPLARWMIGYSPWCESTGHSDKVWPFAWIVPVTHMKTRLCAELQNLSTSKPLLPALSSRDEAFGQLGTLSDQFNRAQSSATHPYNSRVTVRIACQDVPFRKTLIDGLKTLQFEVLNDGRPDIQIVVIEQWDDREADRVKAVNQESPQAQMIVVCDLLTRHQRTSLHERGIETASALRFFPEFEQAMISRHAG
jgi:hypothetical protein